MTRKIEVKFKYLRYWSWKLSIGLGLTVLVVTTKRMKIECIVFAWGERIPSLQKKVEKEKQDK